MLAGTCALPYALGKELADIHAADCSSARYEPAVRARAARFELEVGRRLKSLGASFYTEDDVRAAGGRLTPDFLIRGALRINGRVVRWLDAKSYPLFDCPLTNKNIARQVAKYTAAFGPGALVFSKGVACGKGFPLDPLILSLP
jgi:hypothetical protein